jgi:hypothetical protein
MWCSATLVRCGLFGFGYVSRREPRVDISDQKLSSSGARGDPEGSKPREKGRED